MGSVRLLYTTGVAASTGGHRCHGDQSARWHAAYLEFAWQGGRSNSGFQGYLIGEKDTFAPSPPPPQQQMQVWSGRHANCSRRGQEDAQPCRRPSRRALATSQGEHSSKRCPRCARPWRVCLCGALPAAQLESRTQIILFTHPKEAKRALGTGPLLQLCLKRVVKLVAKEFPDPEKDPNFHQQLKAQPLLLYPGRDAVELSRTETPLSLILIDARWDQARIMLNRSEWLKRLPRATIPFQQSGYMWRRQPAPGCVSTLEAAAEALRILEPHGQQLKSALLQPFQKMVQLQCQFMPKAQTCDRNHFLTAL